MLQFRAIWLEPPPAGGGGTIIKKEKIIVGKGREEKGKESNLSDIGYNRSGNRIEFRERKYNNVSFVKDTYLSYAIFL